MEVEIRRYQKELQIPFVYVTHNQEEALTMSDRIAVMRNGAFEQIGAKIEIYTNPGDAPSSPTSSAMPTGSRAGSSSSPASSRVWTGRARSMLVPRPRRPRRRRRAVLHQVRGSGDRAPAINGSRPMAATPSPARCATSSSRARPPTTSSSLADGSRSSSAARRARLDLQPGEAVVVHWPAGRGACFVV